MDPLKIINVLQIIQWVIKAWKEDVSNQTINNCWVKFNILNFKYKSMTRLKAENTEWKNDFEYDQIVRQIKDQIRDLIKQQKIISVMIIDQFLNLISEIVKDEDKNLINVVVDAYSVELYEAIRGQHTGPRPFPLMWFFGCLY